MRIISGKYRGRKLTAPKNLPVRPTTDFAKEALFNILNHRFYLDEIKVLDLFAGIGGISLEFISRGAESVDAVDKHAKCINFIDESAELLKIDNLSTYRQDVFQFLSRDFHGSYDVIFADPPFDMDRAEYDRIVNTVFENDFLNEGGMLIIEHSRNHKFSAHPNFADHKKYGNVNFSFFEIPVSDEEE